MHPLISPSHCRHFLTSPNLSRFMPCLAPGTQRRPRRRHSHRSTTNSASDTRVGLTCDILRVSGTGQTVTEIPFITADTCSSGRGEIIGDKAGFKTARWGATEADDMKHWCRFPAFSKGLRQSLQKPNLTFKVRSRIDIFAHAIVSPGSNICASSIATSRTYSCVGRSNSSCPRQTRKTYMERVSRGSTICVS